MFYYILFFEVFILSVSRTDPGPSAANPDPYQAPQSPYNYYGYRQTQTQTQTPSPYLNKRNPDNNPYTNAPGIKATPNQCKLHINCPSKKRKKENIFIIE